MRQKGSGTVVQIKSKWYARWTVDGERVYGEPRDSYDEADADRLNQRPQAGEKPKSASEIPTLGEWAHQCQSGRYGDSVALGTHATNETIRLQHIEPAKIAGKRLHRITAHDIEEHLYAVQVTRTRKQGERIVTWKEKPSPSYLRRIAAFESKLFNLARKAGHIRANPMFGVELPAVPERENRVLSVSEAKAILKPERRIDDVMLVALYTGMENGALRRLQWSHIGADTVKVPGTKNSYRKAVIPLAPSARDAIMRQPRRSLFVFTTESGKPLTARNLTRDFNRRKAQLGLPQGMRLHDLRGSFASMLVEQGEDARTVMELMRHNKVSTTLGVYARSTSETQRAAIETFDLRLKGEPVDKRGKKSARG